MGDFSQQISTFVNYGTYDYRLDEVGNVILNPSSSTFQNHYVAFNLRDFIYNPSKISSFYDVNFTEFVPQSTSSVVPPVTPDPEELAAALENAQLSAQLDQLISQNEQVSNTAITQAVKDIIIDLRIQLGEGKSESDFEEEFPYNPKPFSSRETAPTQ
jgi:hypothetical protein